MISYSHVAYYTSAAKHPTACYIPKPATGRPSVFVDPDRIEDLFRPDGAPKKMDDYLHNDKFQLGLHVVSFLDQTLATVYFPHTLMDGMSMAPFLDAWILALQGRAVDIKRPVGAAQYAHKRSNDPLDDFGKRPTVKHVLANHQMSITGLSEWMLRNAKSLFTGLENRMNCVPASTMDMLYKEAIIDSVVDRVADEPAPFLSDGDVLCAWWTRLWLATADVAQTSENTIVLNSAYSLCKILSDLHVDLNGVQNTNPLPGSGKVYVSNLVALFNVILTVGDILQKPLYYTALASKGSSTYKFNCFEDK